MMLSRWGRLREIYREDEEKTSIIRVYLYIHNVITIIHIDVHSYYIYVHIYIHT